QNKALHHICTAFKTTSIQALQIEAACPPIRYKLNLISMQAALRFNWLSKYSQVHDPSHLFAYSDGSQLESNGIRWVGAALALYHQTMTVREQTIRLGRKAEVYDAEMEGLAQAAREAVAFAMNQSVFIKHLHIFADNTSALQNIFDAAP
ncbi:hypothetical protein K439DRAFT_1294521, partial [Ramaria rubella]